LLLLALSYVAASIAKKGDAEKALKFAAEHFIHKACMAYVFSELASLKKNSGDTAGSRKDILQAIEHSSAGITNPTLRGFRILTVCGRMGDK